jgi:hypothetical protein
MGGLRTNLIYTIRTQTDSRGPILFSYCFFCQPQSLPSHAQDSCRFLNNGLNTKRTASTEPLSTTSGEK